MLGGITEALNDFFGRRATAMVVAPLPVIDADSVRPHADRGIISSESARRRSRSPDKRRLQHRPVREHAKALLEWIQVNVDVESFGLILHEHVLEFYCEMLAERGWWERKWNPVAREFDLLTTSGRKPYCWTIGRNGQSVRKRHYPIPRARQEAASAPPRRAAA